jgi:pilus assembly protein CpaB
MSSRFTMGLAGLFLVGAIFVGSWGLVLSHQPAPVTETVSQPTAPVMVEKVVAAAEDQTRQRVVVLVRDVPPFQFTQLALGSASEGLARNDTVATLHPGIEVIRGNQASQQTP